MASPQCCANPPTLNPACGQGKVVDSFGGIPAYVAGTEDSKAAVILISDVFGFEAPKLREYIKIMLCTELSKYSAFIKSGRKMDLRVAVTAYMFIIIPTYFGKIADKVASSGYFVVVPDFFNGDPHAPGNTGKPFAEWIKEHAPEKGFEKAKPVISALKEQGVSSVGAAGYCWGAKVVADLAKANEIQAAVMLHPSFVTVDDIKEVKSPIAILGAETDMMSPPELVKQFEQVLSSSNTGIVHFVKIFPGVSHGWTVRYDSEDAAAVKCAEEALADMTSWFDKNLK